MSSLSTKVSKNRSPGSSKVRATKAKKSASKKPKRPGKITASPKSKKASPAKSKKQVASRKAVSNKKVVSKKKPVKAQSAKAAKKARPVKVVKKTAPKAPARKQVVSRVVASRVRQPVQPVQPPPKRQPAPSTLIAVRAFEQALKLFNRHQYAESKSAFEDILKKFSDQAEIVAGVRTYLAITEQRLARTPSVPRSPDALYNQGVFELNRGNANLAIELFEKALKAEPRADHVLYSLSAAYARLNDPTKALDALRRAIAIRSVHRSHARRDPDFINLHTNQDFQHLTGFGFEFNEE